MAKTPEYTRKATANYQSKFDLIQIRLPKGTKDKIKSLFNTESVNNYIVDLVIKDLQEQEQKQRVEEFAKRNNSNNEEVYNDLPFDIN